MHPGSISISTGNDCLPGDRVIQGSVIAQNEKEKQRESVEAVAVDNNDDDHEATELCASTHWQ